MEEVTAKISGVIFSNKTTGFCILRVVLDGHIENLTVQGSFPGILNDRTNPVGLKAKFIGKFGDDPKHGRRLYAQSCDVIPEKGRVGIVQYLVANVPSIGLITAYKLYDALGDDLVNVLNTDPEHIRTLGFLQSRQADAIIQEWSQSSENRTTAIFLTDLGLSSYQIRNVISKIGVGQAARDKIKENPYFLYECPGVGFSTADSAARKLGVDVDDPRRVSSMILFVMSELANSDGHVYCESKQILDYVNQKLFKRHALSPFTHGDFMSESHFYSALMDLKSKEAIHIDGNRNYLAGSWVAENDSAYFVSQMAIQPPCALGDLSSILKEFETEKQLQLSDEQREAFFMLEKSRICVISGAPGTGKTLLTSAFVYLFEQNNLHYQLLSPTGIAAKRLSQITGKPASTIHRALGYGCDGEWEHSRHNKYFCDAVIVDEMSMIDSNTFYHLISSLPSSTILVLVGDKHQLPSVGAGDVLHNLMDCSDVPHVSLQRIYRQEQASDIIKVAHKMLGGKSINTDFQSKSDFVFLRHHQEKVLDEIRNLSQVLKTKSESSHVPFTFQVISPVYAGVLGVDNLNLELREVLNSGFSARTSSFIKHGEVNFFEGDRVMVVKNDYDRMIFNGDVGKIQRISVKHDEFEVKIFDWFDQEASVPTYMDKIFTFKVEEAKNVLRVAYACTVHRTQGKEYDYVLMPMTKDYGIMLYRNLIYTAITRAKKKVFILGDSDAFNLAINNERDAHRNSYLSELIHDYILNPKTSEVLEITSD